jgi:hypothetical protein
MNLSHHATSAGLLRVTNTENVEILRNYFSISCSRLQNIIYIVDFRVYLHLSSKFPLPEGRACSLLSGKAESPKHPNFLILTSFCV